MTYNKSIGERVFDAFNIVLLVVGSFLFLYPLWFVIVSSVSDAASIASGAVSLWPKGFNLEAYERVFNDSRVWLTYRNTIFYVLAGTLINLVLTTLGAYPLSRRDLHGRNGIMLFIVFTMFFSGGLIPMYLNVRDLGLFDTRWALLLPGAISAYNLIVMRTFFQSTIPDGLIESAKMEGASEYRILWSIVLPLSMPVVAVMTLFYAVYHWNSWFDAMIYLQDRSLHPLQLLLREILVSSQTNDMLGGVGSGDVVGVSETIKYATTVIATLPILVIYPFLQKYFAKGVMLGGVKE
ncbi:carbohydrate ABC transporter permease [Paenibacillus sp. PAMC21692]|uniref:carbohydrate ABC transporter permease n=1 Tax=Paenibacillus sp. PAMC21692 TaxID=2762320 RepID=UPI00164ECC44|nr:carbohydrate ABC transporter permease [Paenibacillus sp. PAMC21692]QNK59379.1 carbohydrate ABC transporter permease [Paenibacillus sp. PAMC21692]